jgi:histidyl-tRNA synthetase
MNIYFFGKENRMQDTQKSSADVREVQELLLAVMPGWHHFIARPFKQLFREDMSLEMYYCLQALRSVREAGIRAELYPDAAKMKKQMSYANAKQIPFVALVGESEMADHKITLKNMQTGDQQSVTVDELINTLNA